MWAGEFISAIGSGLSFFALSVYIFRRMGFASPGAMMMLAAFIAMLVMSVPYGHLSDRWDRRLLMILGIPCPYRDFS